jgi:hypothetical protein
MMAADNKGDLKFWVGVAGVLVTAGGGLYMAHEPVWGLRLIISGLGAVLLCVLAVIVPPLRAGLFKLSRSALGALRWIARTIWEAIVKAGAVFLRPFIRQILRGDDIPQWTAEPRQSGQRGSYDFKSLSREGHRVDRAQFVVFPDHSCKGWGVGFALSETPECSDPTAGYRDKTVCAVEPMENPRVAKLLCHRENNNCGSDLTRNTSKANFLFGLTCFRKAADRLTLNVNVDGSGFCEFDIPAKDTRNLILCAWAGSGEFRVEFTEIHVSWVPE